MVKLPRAPPQLSTRAARLCGRRSRSSTPTTTTWPCTVSCPSWSLFMAGAVSSTASTSFGNTFEGEFRVHYGSASNWTDEVFGFTSCKTSCNTGLCEISDVCLCVWMCVCVCSCVCASFLPAGVKFVIMFLLKAPVSLIVKLDRCSNKNPSDKM